MTPVKTRKRCGWCEVLVAPVVRRVEQAVQVEWVQVQVEEVQTKRDRSNGRSAALPTCVICNWTAWL